jgi:hypothetical protein
MKRKLFLGIGGFLLCLNQILGQATAGTAVHPLFDQGKTITVRPDTCEELLINPSNPGKGWQLWGSGDHTAEEWLYGSLCQSDYIWADIEPSEGIYNWSRIDAEISASKAHGKTFAFGILNFSGMGDTIPEVPQWVFDAGAKYTMNNQTCQDYNPIYGKQLLKKKAPVWDDPVYMAKMDAMVQALANRYNGNPYIEYIQIMNFGNWGEWHLYCMDNTTDISDAKKRELIDMYAKKFTKTRLMVAINTFEPGDPIPDYAKYACDTWKVSLRREGLIRLPFSQWGLYYCYNKTPASGEWWGGYSQMKEMGYMTLLNLDNSFSQGFLTYNNLAYGMKDEAIFFNEWRSHINYWTNHMGYYFRLVEATYPQNLGNGSFGNIILKFRNDGIAPIYIKAYVKLALLDANNNVLKTTTLTGIDPFNWKPLAWKANTTTTEVTEVHNFSFPRTANPERLAVGLFSDTTKTTPDIRLGTKGRLPNGWYPL